MGRNCMRKLLLLVAMFSLQLVGSQYVPDKLGNARILLLKKGFAVQRDGKKYKIAEHNLDQTLRKMSSEQRSKYFSKGHVELNQLSDGEYSLKANPKLKGGGVFGAWLGSTLGYGLVTFAGHGAIQLIAVCTGPFYVPVSGTLHKMLAVPIHTAATTAGIAGGIAGGVATGPV